MADLNDLLVAYGPTSSATANKLALFADLGPDQDSVFDAMIAATSLTRATTTFNDALVAYLQLDPTYNPLTAETWQSLLWMSSPNQTPPADGAAVTAWAQDGAQGDGWANSGTVNYDEVDAAFGDQPALDQASGGSLVDNPTSIDAACTVVIVGEVLDNELNFQGDAGGNGPLVGAFSGAYLCASQGFGGTASGGTATTGPHLLVAEFTGSAVTLEVDGTAVISGASLTTGAIDNTVQVGAPGFSGYTGAQAFVGVVNGTLADKAALEAWVTDTYGITIA